MYLFFFTLTHVGSDRQTPSFAFCGAVDWIDRAWYDSFLQIGHGANKIEENDNSQSVITVASFLGFMTGLPPPVLNIALESRLYLLFILSEGCLCLLLTSKVCHSHHAINPTSLLLQFYRVLTCFEPAGGRKLLDWKWSPTSGKWEGGDHRVPSPWLTGNTEEKLIDTKLNLRLS